MFTERGWSDYLSWQHDKRVLRRIHQLIAEVQRDAKSGLGKPEQLRGDYSGWWSRRIDEQNRLVYRVENGAMEVAQCAGHYQDR